MEDFEEDYEEDMMVLVAGEDGKAEIKMASEIEKQRENQNEIIVEFIKENVKLFSDFLTKKGITEDDFNKGIIHKKPKQVKE